MLADARGRPLKVRITPGQQGDITTAPELLAGVEARHVLADTAYDSNALRALITAIKAKAVIPSNPTRRHLILHDKVIYRRRNAIERCFNRLKHFRRFATRYDRRASRFLAFIHLACATQWMA
jgi:transposase